MGTRPLTGPLSLCYLLKDTTYSYLYIQDKEKEIKAEFKQSNAEKRNEKKDSLSALLFFSAKERTSVCPCGKDLTPQLLTVISIYFYVFLKNKKLSYFCKEAAELQFNVKLFQSSPQSCLTSSSIPSFW